MSEDFQSKPVLTGYPTYISINFSEVSEEIIKLIMPKVRAEIRLEVEGLIQEFEAHYIDKLKELERSINEYQNIHQELLMLQISLQTLKPKDDTRQPTSGSLTLGVIYSHRQCPICEKIQDTTLLIADKDYPGTYIWEDLSGCGDCIKKSWEEFINRKGKNDKHSD